MTATLPTQALNRRILTLLAEERSLHGHGSAALIDHRLGKSEGYVGRLLRGEIGLQVEMLGLALEALDVDPAEFFTRAVGARLVPVRVLRRLERLCLDRDGGRGAFLDPSLLRRIERVAEELPDVAEAGGKGVGRHRVSQEAETELDQTLARLDEICFSEPAAAVSRGLEQLERRLRRIEEGTLGRCSRERVQLARFLGVVASIERLESRYRSSAGGLRRALELLAGTGYGVTEAEILQRATYLIADQGDHAVAFEVIRQAGELYVLHRYLPGLGQVLIQRAVLHGQAEQWEMAHDSFKAGLEYLQDAPWIWKFSAYQGLGIVELKMDRVEAAMVWARRAATEHRTRRGQNWWRLQWLEGEIARCRGDLETAEQALRRARSGFSTRSNPLDVAVVTLDLAQVLLMGNRMLDVQALAAEMMGLLRQFQRHRMASAALHELARASLTGEVTLGLIRRIGRRLRKESSLGTSLIQGWMP